jgi:hypothetical protein
VASSLIRLESRKDLNMGVRNPLVQHAWEGITCILVLGALSMIWPVIMTLFLGLFLLFQSRSPEQEIAALLWTEVDNWPIFVDSLRRPVLPAILS